MGFITLDSGHVVHASCLPPLNPHGGIEIVWIDPETGKIHTLVEKTVDLDGEVVDLVDEHFWDLI